MFRRLGLLFAALAFFSLAGGHWAVLQSVAWAGMLHDYARRSGSVAVAVAQTFDGHHPCDLCREIAAAKGKEQPEKPVAPGVKDDARLQATLADAASQPFAPAAIPAVMAADRTLSGPSWAEPPPTPPPRRGFVAA